MRAVLFRTFGEPLDVETVPDPAPPADGVVLRVEATGVCRSDWHAWLGHDPDVALPHVPGHELAGVVEAVGPLVTRWRVGDRVTVPFVLGCGNCPRCADGQQHVCDHQFQPGFTAWGSFAEYVALPRADANLIALPHTMGFAEAASLGCRFATSFRAVVDQAEVQPGEWLAVHGCGGVGLSAVMIATAMGVGTIAVDIADDALALAKACGATITVNARDTDPVVAIHEVTGGGAHASIDAVGTSATCIASIRSLRTQGRHVQVGLMLAEHATPPVPMALLHSREIVLIGSHGMPAHAYPRLLALVAAGRVAPGALVTSQLTLSEGAHHLSRMGDFPGSGMAVITDLSR
ncbi:MAG: zinc-dependent alcohol dehydrogenase family protein [Actinomycetota bacterium]